MRNGIPGLCLLTAAFASCAPPGLEFFTSPAPRFTPVTPVVDTVLVVRRTPTDSVSLEAVHLAFDLLDRARGAERPDAARAIASVLDAVPDSVRVRGPRPGSADSSILKRLGAQRGSVRYDLVRADAVIIGSVEADTVVVAGKAESDDYRPSEQWVALILYGDAVLDPELGRRAGEEGR